MPRFIGRDEAQARASLAAIGTQIVAEADRDAVIAEYLDEASRFDRGDLVVDPPAEGAQFEAFGAWHVNNNNEFHSIVSGEGLLEFATPDGTVSVILGPGDIMANTAGCEHRYRPLSTQSWIVRIGGGPDSELVASNTGREDTPFATV